MLFLIISKGYGTGTSLQIFLLSRSKFSASISQIKARAKMTFTQKYHFKFHWVKALRIFSHTLIIFFMRSLAFLKGWSDVRKCNLREGIRLYLLIQLKNEFTFYIYDIGIWASILKACWLPMSMISFTTWKWLVLV